MAIVDRYRAVVVQPTAETRRERFDRPGSVLCSIKTATALPWLLVGMTASIFLVIRLGGDVRRSRDG